MESKLKLKNYVRQTAHLKEVKLINNTLENLILNLKIAFSTDILLTIWRNRLQVLKFIVLKELFIKIQGNIIET